MNPLRRLCPKGDLLCAPYLLGACLVLLVSAWHLAGAARCGQRGFPLDDAWIHQTYARNLATRGQFAFGSEGSSVGSTSPLWTALLSLGYLVGSKPLPWAYALGVASWLLVAWISASLAQRLFPQERRFAFLVGLACLAEWHLAWAAFSGMEILVFTFLSLLLLERWAARARPAWLGLIGGLSILVRPEAIVLVGLVATLTAVEVLRRPISGGSRHSRLPALAGLGAGLALSLLPYLATNLWISGRPFPNTLYAKQAEYRVLLEQPLWTRLWSVSRQPWIGAQVLLIPGLVALVSKHLRGAVKARRNAPSMRQLLPLVWSVSLHLVYALRLPVAYQHGRYLMPTIPVLLLYGVLGTAEWMRRLKPANRPSAGRVLVRAAILAVGCLFVAFLALGGRAYAEDVCIVQGEMVDVALWLRANTPPDALVATHDIGAIGYWSDRSLIDLAGLVTPQVIPIVGDEERLLAYILRVEAEYLVAFPSWYPTIVSDERLARIYQTDSPVTRAKGRDNMAVYQIDR